jgi:hypothetical protein
VTSCTAGDANDPPAARSEAVRSVGSVRHPARVQSDRADSQTRGAGGAPAAGSGSTVRLDGRPAGGAHRERDAAVALRRDERVAEVIALPWQVGSSTETGSPSRSECGSTGALVASSRRLFTARGARSDE